MFLNWHKIQELIFIFLHVWFFFAQYLTWATTYFIKKEIIFIYQFFFFQKCRVSFAGSSIIFFCELAISCIEIVRVLIGKNNLVTDRLIFIKLIRFSIKIKKKKGTAVILQTKTISKIRILISTITDDM